MPSQKKSSNKLPNGSSQFERFVETARALGCDEDKESFEKKLGKIAAQKLAKDEAEPKKKRPGKKPSRHV